MPAASAASEAVAEASGGSRESSRGPSVRPGHTRGTRGESEGKRGGGAGGEELAAEKAHAEKRRHLPFCRFLFPLFPLPSTSFFSCCCVALGPGRDGLSFCQMIYYRARPKSGGADLPRFSSSAGLPPCLSAFPRFPRPVFLFLLAALLFLLPKRLPARSPACLPRSLFLHCNT